MCTCACLYGRARERERERVSMPPSTCLPLVLYRLCEFVRCVTCVCRHACTHVCVNIHNHAYPPTPHLPFLHTLSSYAASLFFLLFFLFSLSLPPSLPFGGGLSVKENCFGTVARITDSYMSTWSTWPDLGSGFRPYLCINRHPALIFYWQSYLVNLKHPFLEKKTLFQISVHHEPTKCTKS